VLLRFPLFGNPNSLGAIMGVAIIPILSWGLLIMDERTYRHRRTLALCVAVYLLLTSASRAGLLASAVTVTVMCLMLGRSKLLAKGALAVAFLIAVLGVIQPAEVSSLVSSLTEQLVYKGKIEQGLLGSRKTPWQDTVSVIKDSPWFGSGFGTDRIAGPAVSDSMYRTIEGSGREHGSSYMALLQFVGLLGVVPFAILLLLVFSGTVRTCAWMRRTRNPHNYAIPLAMVCLAGLIHATFEDWMFAAGYHLSLFFWTSAFLLSDFLPRRANSTSFAVNAARRPVAIDSQVAALANQDAFIH
jgi:O-antigen ligase